MRKIAEDIRFDQEALEEGFSQTSAYYGCIFDQCSFNDKKPSRQSFEDCTFQNCDLSLWDLDGCTLKNVAFIECKMVGIKLDNCSKLLFSIHCKECNMDYAILSGIDFRKSSFLNCSLIESDFLEANLSKIKPIGCNFERANFAFSNLDYTDFSESKNILFKLDINKTNGTLINQESAINLLKEYKIEVKY